MSKHQLTTRQKEELITSVDQLIETLTNDFSVFITLTYFPYVRFNKRPFEDNYFDVYEDNRLLKRLIDHEFFRNPNRSETQYLFVVERHRFDPKRLHVHFLMTRPDVTYVRHKYQRKMKFHPFLTIDEVVKKSIPKIRLKLFDPNRVDPKKFNIRECEIKPTTDVFNLKSYVTKEIRKYSNLNCIDFQNSTFSRILNPLKTTPISDDSKLDTVTDDRPIERQ